MTIETARAFDTSTLWAQSTRTDNPPYFHKNPDHIVFDFDQGTPDRSLFPVDDLLRISKEILDREGSRVLDYFDRDYGYKSMFLGWDPLREQIAEFVGRRDGRTPSLEEIIVVHGSAQGVALAGRAFLEAGDAVIVEGATFPFALRYFGQAGGTAFFARVDGEGLDPDSVVEQLKAAKSQGLLPKAIYTIPTGQLPTGTIMPLERRQRLLEIAAEWNLVVIEDAIYSPFQYEGEKVPSLWSLDREGRVLQSDAFTKTIAPSMRTGWMLGSKETILGMATVRQDLGTSMWTAQMLAQYLREGLLEPHIAESVKLYRQRRDTTERALREFAGDFLDWSTPKAAFYYWLTLSDRVDWDDVARGMFDAGIAMRPGEKFLGGGDDGAKHLRMSFAHMNEEGLVDGMKAFGQVLHGSAR